MEDYKKSQMVWIIRSYERSNHFGTGIELVRPNS